MAIVELYIWQRDGTAGTKFAVSTEGNSLKASVAMCSYTVGQSVIWLWALYFLYARHHDNGGEMRMKMSVPSLIRETRPVECV